MKRTRNIYLALLAVLLSPMAAKADLIYTVNQTVGGATVTGTITTDGTIGILDDANITAFTLTLDDGTYNVPITEANGGTHFVASGNGNPDLANGSPLTATATQLIFDFNSTGFVHFQLDPVDTGTPFWCLAGTNSTAHCLGTTGAEMVKTSKNPSVSYTNRMKGQMVVATRQVQVPEPGTLALLGLGLAGIGFAKRKKA